MDVAPENAITHMKAASFDSLWQTVEKLKSIHTSSELIQFVSQKLPVETSYALQEYQSVSTSIHKYVFFS